VTARPSKTRKRLHKRDRRSQINAQNIELYSSAYRMALGRISFLQKREQPDLASWLHDFIRHEIKDGATDPSTIATKALNALDERARSRSPNKNDRGLG
jgi:hypothetical protein